MTVAVKQYDAIYLVSRTVSYVGVSFVVICSPVVAPVFRLGSRLELEYAVRLRDVVPRQVAVRPTVTVVGRIPSRPFLGCVMVARSARGE